MARLFSPFPGPEETRQGASGATRGADPESTPPGAASGAEKGPQRGLLAELIQRIFSTCTNWHLYASDSPPPFPHGRVPARIGDGGSLAWLTMGKASRRPERPWRMS